VPITPVILHIIDTTGPGGAETVFTQLAAETQKRGFKTIALIRGKGWVQAELERLAIDVRVIDCKGSINFKFLFALISLIRKERVVLIQSHLLGSNVYANLAGLLCRLPVVSTFHGFVDLSRAERLAYFKFLIIKMGASKVIAVTEQLRLMLANMISFSKQQLVVISNGVDTDLFSPKDQRENLSTKIKIGCLGNVREAKNYPLAIRVVKKLITDGHIVELRIAGDCNNKLTEECIKLADDLGISEHIKFVGFITDAPAYLSSLDIFLLSSSSEGHPLALTQAMAMGKPIVATRCGIENIISDGETALIAENGDEDSVQEKLVLLLGDAKLRNKIGSAARIEAVNKWSFSTMADAYLANYKHFLGMTNE
jgi:glycosyltransferase involved in cell wall biosynthesis